MDLNQERELIEKARKDPASFGVVFDIYYPKILGYVLKRTANLQVAEDITSEVFFKALSKLWQFKWKNVSFSSWLYKIASNEIYDHFRGHKKASISLDYLLNEGFDVADNVNPESELIRIQQEIEDHKDYIKIQRNLAKLSSKYQEVLSLRYLEKKTILEVCEILNKKEGTIKSLLSRGIDKLTLEIKKDKSQPPVPKSVIESRS